MIHMKVIWELGSVRRHLWSTGDNILAVFQKSSGLVWVCVDFFDFKTVWYQPFGLLRIHKEPVRSKPQPQSRELPYWYPRLGLHTNPCCY